MGSNFLIRLLQAFNTGPASQTNGFGKHDEGRRDDGPRRPRASKWASILWVTVQDYYIHFLVLILRETTTPEVKSGWSGVILQCTCTSDIPANEKRWPNVVLKLCQRLRRWHNFKTTLDLRFMFVGMHNDSPCLMTVWLPLWALSRIRFPYPEIRPVNI